MHLQTTSDLQQFHEQKHWRAICCDTIPERSRLPGACLHHHAGTHPLVNVILANSVHSQEVDDIALLATVALAFGMNLILMIQIGIYWNAGPAAVSKEEVKKKTK